ARPQAAPAIPISSSRFVKQRSLPAASCRRSIPWLRFLPRVTRSLPPRPGLLGRSVLLWPIYRQRQHGEALLRQQLQALSSMAGSSGRPMARKECDTSPHGWTLDTLEEFLSSKISALSNFTTAESRASKEAVAAALEAVKEQSNAAMQAAAKAIDKAELATERRFEGVNEFRQTLSDQARTFMNREEYAIGHR